jgi:hypothetical protein
MVSYYTVVSDNLHNAILSHILKYLQMKTEKQQLKSIGDKLAL